MSYKNAMRRTVHTGLYTDKAAELVKKVLAVCVPRMSSSAYGTAMCAALRMNSSVYRDPSGEVVISNADHSMYESLTRKVSEDDTFKCSLRSLTDAQILRYIAKVLKSTMTKHPFYPEDWRFDSKMHFKDMQSFYRCYPHIDPLLYIDDNGDYDYDDSCCLVQNVRLSFKDAYFIWAKFNGNEKKLKKLPKSYVEKITGEPNNIVKYEALKAVEDETVDLIDSLISRKRDLMQAEKTECRNAEDAIIAAFDLKHKELNREFTEKYNAIKETAVF